MTFHRLIRLLLAACVPGAAVGVLVGGSVCLGEDFQSTLTAKFVVYDTRWEWSNPNDWQKPDLTNGVPSSAQDVGIVSDGHHLCVGEPLGTPNNRPTIRLEKGGVLWMHLDLENPLVLDGGYLNGAWLGKNVLAPITITADSTIGSRDPWGNWEIEIAGPVSNPKPVTLHINGAVRWGTDSSKTFTGAIDVDRGTLRVVGGPVGSGILGTGPIQLATETILMIGQLPRIARFPVSNDLSGIGTIYAGNIYPQNVLAFSGATLHPGMPGEPGTMCVRAGSFEFQRNAGRPVQFVIEVRGDGSNPKADYSQLAVFGNLADSLNNADLILRLKPDMTPEQAAALKLNVITTQKNAATRPQEHFQPFHSVQVIAGNRKGTATVNVVADPLTEGSDVEVSDIRLQ